MSVASVEPVRRHQCVGARGRMGGTTRPTRPRPVQRPPHVSTPAAVGNAGAGLRLTRRGRFVLVALAILVIAVSVAWGATRVSMAATGDTPSSVTVVVGAHDSLWSIAGDVAPQADRRETVTRTIAVNDLHGARIEPGQRLVVPVPG